jgi:glucan phosphoethanolaminetransferase (alkaline phosphatase superfamily)
MKAIALYQYRRKQHDVSKLLPVFFIYLLLLLPAVAVVIFKDFKAPPDYLLARLAASCAVFTVPVVFFYKHLKLYLYLLAVWIVLAPALIFFVAWLKVSLNFSLVALLMQTNSKELLEATQGYRLPFLLCTLGYLLLYVLAVKRTGVAQLPFKTAAALSAAALLLLGGYALAKRYKYRYMWTDDLEETYPLGLFSGLHQANAFMK